MSSGVFSKKIPALLGLKNQFYLLKWSHNHSLNHYVLHLENVDEKNSVVVHPLCCRPVSVSIIFHLKRNLSTV